MAIEDEFQFRDRPLERRKLSGVERSSTTPTMTSAPLPTLRGHHGADRADKAVVEQALGAAMTGGGADPDRFGQLGIAEPSVPLQQTQHLEVDAVESDSHGTIFHEMDMDENYHF